MGRLNLGGWKLRCPLELSECHLRHRLDLAKAEAPNITLRGSYLRSRLSARQLRTAHTLNLTNGFHCDRGAVLKEAHIGGQLDCTEAIFTNSNGQTLNANGLTVDGNMTLDKAHCTGAVSLFGAHIGGHLNCTEAVFTNPNGQALSAADLSVDGSMILIKAHCTGAVSLSGAHIGDHLNCTGADFINPNGQALNAARLSVDIDMTLDKTHCTGAVSLFGAHIGGHLVCTEAIFTNPNGQALSAMNLNIDGSMILDKAHCTGAVSLFGAHIGGHLNCTEAVFSSNSEDRAVNLQTASVGQSVIMRPAALCGSLDLHRAQVGVWYDEKRTWPTRLELEGFVYGSIDAPDATVKDRLKSWLPRNSYLPQPYEQLAGVYRREGNEQNARTVAIGKQRARRAASAQRWNPPADDRSWPSGYLRHLWSAMLQAWSTVLRWTIGYGYRPALALVPLALLILIGSVLFQLLSHHPDLLHPAKTGAEQPSFNALRYTVDLLLPVANFKQRDSFVTGGWAAWASFGFIFTGWLLAAIVVAGLTGVFKRD